jgi:S-adenosylmethionine decarboxylase
MTGGTEWVVDASGCREESLASLPTAEALLDEVVARLELTVVARSGHVFPSPGGVTSLYLLSESHLTVHTFPESGVATLNLYCCRPRPELDWGPLLADRLGATGVVVRRLDRGLDAFEGAPSEVPSAFRPPGERAPSGGLVGAPLQEVVSR